MLEVVVKKGSRNLLERVIKIVFVAALIVFNVKQIFIDYNRLIQLVPAIKNLVY